MKHHEMVGAANAKGVNDKRVHSCEFASGNLFRSIHPLLRLELRAALFRDHPDFARPNLIAFDWAPPKLKAVKIGKGTGLTYPIADFYLTNAIARSSPTMQRCSAELLHGETFAEAAE